MSKKFDGDINAYSARRDGSLDIHLEIDMAKAKVITDEYGNFFVRVQPHDVPRLMHAAIDALNKKASTR